MDAVIVAIFAVLVGVAAADAMSTADEWLAWRWRRRNGR